MKIAKDFLGKEWEYDCMGCAIGRGAMLVPGGLIQRTDYFCVHQDPLIPLPGFLVIASHRHIQSMTEMGESEYRELSRLFRRTHSAIKTVTKVDYLTLVQEEHSPHFHLWFFPWTHSVIDRYGQPSLTKIRDIMADYRRQPLGEAEWAELELAIEQVRTVLRGES